MVKKVGKRGRKKKPKNNMMQPYVEFVGLAMALAEANEDDIIDGNSETNSSYQDNKRFVNDNDKEIKDVYAKARLRGESYTDIVPKKKPYQKKNIQTTGGRDTSTGEHGVLRGPDTMDKLTQQQTNFLTLAKYLETAEYYEVDPQITRHLQETDPLSVDDSEFKLPFNRCFFSAVLDCELGRITGMVVNRTSFYIMRDGDGSYTLTRENKEVCTCGKYRYEHGGMNGHGPADDCDYYTWDGKSLAREVEGYALYYRWDYEGEMYIKDALICFPQDGFDEDLLNDSVTTQTIKDFLVNLSFYLTVPERIYVKKKRNMERRFKEGRVPLPSSTYITCNNKMKIYLHKYEEAISEGSKSIKKHRRRGFWRKYIHPKFKNIDTIQLADGTLGKYVWVRPTVVGSGMYLPRHRRVKK